MSKIYNRVYRVPVWVSITNTGKNGDAAASFLREGGALEQPWPSLSFTETIKELATKGWDHAVNKDFPYFMDLNFLPVAVTAHIRKLFGDSKSLSGAPAKPWGHAVNRRVVSEGDFARIFDEILSLEDPIALSHLFSIAENCANDAVNYKVFFTKGQAPKNVLQGLADNVIVVGNGGDIPTSGKTSEKVLSELEEKLVQVMGI